MGKTRKEPEKGEAMSKTKKQTWTVMVWNDSRIQIRRGVAEDRVEDAARNMQITIQGGIDDDAFEDGEDARWQAWEGHAAVEVL